MIYVGRVRYVVSVSVVDGLYVRYTTKRFNPDSKTELPDGRYRYEFSIDPQNEKLNGIWPQPLHGYVVNVTDEHGNRRTAVIQQHEAKADNSDSAQGNDSTSYGRKLAKFAYAAPASPAKVRIPSISRATQPFVNELRSTGAVVRANSGRIAFHSATKGSAITVVVSTMVTTYTSHQGAAYEDVHVTGVSPTGVPMNNALTTYTVGGTTATLYEGHVAQRGDFVRGYGMAYLAATSTTQKEKTEDQADRSKEDIEKGDPIEPRPGPNKPPKTIIRTVQEAVRIYRIAESGRIIGRQVQKTSADEDEVNDDLRVRFIDVGKGQAILVHGPEGQNILIDAGTDDIDVTYSDLKSSLAKEGISEIDDLVLTHLHEDHVNMVNNLTRDDEIDVETVFYNGLELRSTDVENETLKLIKSNPGVNVKSIRRGDGTKLPLKGVDVDVLNPPANEYRELASDSRQKDRNSLVLRLSYHGKSFLLTSDIRHTVEENLNFRESTVVQASHHGSRSGNHEKGLIKDANPSRIVITSSVDAPQPHSEVFDRFRDETGAKIKTYWTGAHGDVTFIVDDGTMYPFPWGWIADEPETAETTDPTELKDKYAD